MAGETDFVSSSSFNLQDEILRKLSKAYIDTNEELQNIFLSIVDLNIAINEFETKLNTLVDVSITYPLLFTKEKENGFGMTGKS